MTLLTLLSLRTPKRQKKTSQPWTPPASCQDCQSSESNEICVRKIWMKHGRSSAGYFQSHFFSRHRFQLAGFQAFRPSFSVKHLRSSHGAANQFRAMAIWTASPANAEAKFSSDVHSEVPKNLRKHVKKIDKVTYFSEIMVIIHHICFCLSMFERVCPYAIWLYDQNSPWKPIFWQEKGISYQLLLQCLANKLEAQWPMT